MGLYNRARMLEEHEKQYAASGASQGYPSSGKKTDRFKKPAGTLPVSRVSEKSATETGNSVKERHCFRCKEVGHLRRECPLQCGVQAEAPGKSKSSRTATIEITGSATSTEQLTEQQLLELLAARRLKREKALLKGNHSSATNTIQASRNDAVQTVGPTLSVEVHIEGMPAIALVDTGAQSLIISCSLLHAIGRHRASAGYPPLELERPTVRLFGKDGRKGGHELAITAQVQLTFISPSVCLCLFSLTVSKHACWE